MAKRLSLVVFIFIVAAIAFAIWEPSLVAEDASSQRAFDAGQVEKGKVLAGIGNCATCHTVSPDKPYAGGVDFPTPFGTLYSTNITPHPQQGIGNWSREAFVRAMREGLSANGSHLYPAFPYTHYKNLTDEDLDALYSYFMSREPVAYTPPENSLTFPFNLRFLQWGWKLMFFDPEPWQPDPEKSRLWNRGAYLARGLGHCSACHTPRNIMGAEKKDRDYAGALVDNWYAPALDDSQPVPVHWDEATLYRYLRSGLSDYHGVAVGSMGDVVHRGLDRASDGDIRALASYLATLPGGEATGAAQVQPAEIITAAQQRAKDDHSAGAALYLDACAPCHYNAPQNPMAIRAELSLNSTVTADDPTNLIRVVIEGIGAGEGSPTLVMPGFAALSDHDLVELVQFLRRRSGLPEWNDLRQRVKELRQLHRQSQVSESNQGEE